MPETESSPGPLTPRTTFLICAGLLALFGALSYSAAWQKAATFDENVHVPAAWAHLHHGDFRVNPEHPPLWKYWAALPLVVWHPVKMDPAAPQFAVVLQDLPLQWEWAVQVLYRTPGNDADRIVAIGRAMMLVAGLALGALVAWWSWKLGGAVAAIVATALFAFDPNFLAHASLVTNDVAFSLVALALIHALWRLGQRATWPRLGIVAILCAVGINTKFSGLLLGPLILIVLLARALMKEPWEFWGRSLVSTRAKVWAAVGVCAGAGVASFVLTWGVYRFRFDPTPAPGVSLNMPALVRMTQVNELYRRHPGEPVTDEEREKWIPSLLTGFALFAEHHRLLPQAFVYGVLHVHMASQVRNAFLMGEISETGFWNYFPLAMAFKTPLASLAAMAGALGVALLTRKRWWGSHQNRWLTICLGLPGAVYFLYVMRANLNLGLRHILPLYPLIYIGIGLAAAWAWREWGTKARIATGVLLLGLAVESSAAFPDYIPFFNAAAGGSRGGYRLLGDSNLDWGQDLKPLAKWAEKWHRDNPGKAFYLRYFGIADPAYYKIDYRNLPGGYGLGPEMKPPDAPGVIAISATRLQGIYDDAALRKTYEPLRHAEPFAVIGGTIYLFEYPLPPGR